MGTVCWSVKLADGRGITRTVRLPGDRADIRERSTTVAMHLLRRLLSRHESSPAGRGRACSWRSTCRTGAARRRWRDALSTGAVTCAPCVPRRFT